MQKAGLESLPHHHRPMNPPLTTQSLIDRAAASLSWLTEQGFKYAKGATQYRRAHPQGLSIIAINVVRHGDGSYQLAFNLGVLLAEVQTWMLTASGNPRKLGPHDRTLWNFTVNIGPESPHWPYPIEGCWHFGSLDDFDAQEPEITAFIRDLALPYVTENITPAQVRRTLLETPGRDTHPWPYQTVLAIDVLAGSPEQLEADIQAFEQLYQNHVPDFRQRFENYVALMRSKA